MELRDVKFREIACWSSAVLAPGAWLFDDHRHPHLGVDTAVKEALALMTSAFSEVSGGSERIVESVAELETEVQALEDKSAGFLTMVRTA